MNKNSLKIEFSDIEKKILSLYTNSGDIHTKTASEIFNVPENCVTPEMRREAKKRNFLRLYGFGFGIKNK